MILYRSYTSHPEVWSQFNPRSVLLFNYDTHSSCRKLISLHYIVWINLATLISCSQEFWLPFESNVTWAQTRWRAEATQPSSKWSKWSKYKCKCSKWTKPHIFYPHQLLASSHHRCHLRNLVEGEKSREYFVQRTQSKPLWGWEKQPHSCRGNPLKMKWLHFWLQQWFQSKLYKCRQFYFAQGIHIGSPRLFFKHRWKTTKTVFTIWPWQCALNLVTLSLCRWFYIFKFLIMQMDSEGDSWDMIPTAQLHRFPPIWSTGEKQNAHSWFYQEDLSTNHKSLQ